MFDNNKVPLIPNDNIHPSFTYQNKNAFNAPKSVLNKNTLVPKLLIQKTENNKQDLSIKVNDNKELSYQKQITCSTSSGINNENQKKAPILPMITNSTDITTNVNINNITSSTLSPINKKSITEIEKDNDNYYFVNHNKSRSFNLLHTTIKQHKRKEFLGMHNRFDFLI